MLFQNGGSSLGTVRINNSYIEMKSTLPMSNGSYVNALLNNSVLRNTDVGTTLSNATAFGLLQVVNTLVYTSGSTSINYSAATVNSMYGGVNSGYLITTLNGEITTITDLI